MLSRGFRRLLSSAPPPPPPEPKVVKTMKSGGGIGSVALWGLGGVFGAGVAWHFGVGDVRGSKLYHYGVSQFGMPLLRLLDPEDAHRAAIKYAWLSPRDLSEDDEVLRTKVVGLDFSNPIGLAAGMDKDGEAMESMFGVGFGFVEVGTVTPLAQPGNPRPRVFRLVEDFGVINRYGFNSSGLEVVHSRLVGFWERLGSGKEKKLRGLLGVNVGKNKTSEDSIADYVQGIRTMANVADYLVINISSPNTPGLRNLQRREFLADLIRAALQARDACEVHPPLFVKIAPDLTPSEIQDIAAAVLDTKVDGVIVSNTTIDRPVSLRSPNRAETGGLSGRPLKLKATNTLKAFYNATNGTVPLIGVGGVESGQDAYDKIRAGASLVQLYTAYSIQGPCLIPKIKQDLAKLLHRDGFQTIQDAVGIDAKK